MAFKFFFVLAAAIFCVVLTCASAGPPSPSGIEKSERAGKGGSSEKQTILEKLRPFLPVAILVSLVVLGPGGLLLLPIIPLLIPLFVPIYDLLSEHGFP